MKNNLTDLNNHLFDQLARLNKENLSNDGMAKEINRSNAITSVAREVIKNGQLCLDVVKFTTEFQPKKSLPDILEHQK